MGHPIYVGKADPDNQAAKDAVSQPGHQAVDPTQRARAQHPQSRHTLDIDDFKCRFLIVKTGFQKSVEDYLLNFFKPIWSDERARDALAELSWDAFGNASSVTCPNWKTGSASF